MGRARVWFGYDPLTGSQRRCRRVSGSAFLIERGTSKSSTSLVRPLISFCLLLRLRSTFKRRSYLSRRSPAAAGEDGSLDCRTNGRVSHTTRDFAQLRQPHSSIVARQIPSGWQRAVSSAPSPLIRIALHSALTVAQIVCQSRSPKVMLKAKEANGRRQTGSRLYKTRSDIFSETMVLLDYL
jgi:hypothetical protein